MTDGLAEAADPAFPPTDAGAAFAPRPTAGVDLRPLAVDGFAPDGVRVQRVSVGR